MKVSKATKKQTKRKIIKSAVDIITKKSFESASMREIAQNAGIGEATIYNYFSTKEQLLFGFIEQTHEDIQKELTKIDGFDEFSLKEKLQMWFETLLIHYLPNREFVEITFNQIHRNPITSMTSLKPIRTNFHDLILSWLNTAIEKNEIEDQAMLNWLSEHLWEYGAGVVWYWLKDQSPQFNQTTQLIDMTLDLVIQCIKSNLLGKVSDIASFLIKAHIFKYFDRNPTSDIIKKALKHVKI